MNNPVNVRTLQAMKGKEKITMLTAYDFPTAQMLDQSGVEMLLVGDSLGMVVQGHSTTVPVTVEEMIYHGRMVVRAAQRAMVIVDLPFPVGQLSVSHTLKVAAKILKETGCQGVKLEGGREQAEIIRRLVVAGIPTIAHVGLRPQTVHALGGYRVQRDEELLQTDALAVQEAGAFAVLMECVPASVAASITKKLRVPTIGIGAGPDCDGQVLVINDLLGWNEGKSPKFVRRYAELRELAKGAIQQFQNDVRSGDFPSERESF